MMVRKDTGLSMIQDPFVCARCADMYPTCCRTAPANRAGCFPLSEAERARLAPYAEALGVPDSETEKNTPEFLNLVRTLFPGIGKMAARAFPPGGTHLRLPLSGDGACLFLQDDGCSLPRDSRPWYCQLFPIWLRGQYFDRFLPEFCLLTREAVRLQDVFTALGLSRERAKTLYLSLRHDWGMENNDEA